MLGEREQAGCNGKRLYDRQVYSKYRQLDGGVGGPGSCEPGRRINQAVVDVLAMPTNVHSHHRLRLAVVSCGIAATSMGANVTGNVYDESAFTSWFKMTSR